MHFCQENWMFAVQLVAILLSHMTPLVDSSLHGISPEELADLFTEFEIVEPFASDSNGNFLSHDIKHGHKRRRRDLSRQNVREQIIDVGTGTAEILGRMPDTIDLYNDVYNENDNSYYDDTIGATINMSEPVKTIKNLTKPLSNINTSDNHIYNDDEDHHIYYNVSAFGTHYHLKLLPKKRLVAPGAKVVWFGYEDEEEDLEMDCVYSGLIRHHHNSTVAITSCEGMSGMIKTADDEFFIEPIEIVTDDDKETKQRHVIYRRSAVLTNLVGKELGGLHERSKRSSGDTTDYDQRPRNALHGDTLAAAITAHSSKFKSACKKNHFNCSFTGGQTTFFDYSRYRRHAKPNEYNMEVLLTADWSVVDFHHRDHVKFYLVTLMNIVDEIYHDESLGSHVNIVLVKLCLLDKSQSNSLIVVNDPPESLQNVCSWANNLATEHPSPTGKRHDHAIFLTRTKFGPAGYAHVAGMCHPLRSCTLNLEDGFSSAFVVAHETGHSLGMEHDGERNKCGDEASMGSIMPPLVQAAFHRYHWSRCSQQEFNVHIGKFSCLLDSAERQEQFGPRPLYPGIPYTVDDQCRFDFGEGYKLCTAFATTEVCQILWCSHEDNPSFCKTRNGGPIDGTKCGENRICFQNHCVWNDQSNWGPWSTATECSRSCGVGAKLRTRTCNIPGTKGNDTSGCEGNAKEFVLCNKDPCPVSNDFRAEQCSKQNRVVRYRDRKHIWLPYHNDELPCELYCESKQTHDVVSLMRNVEDGTPCSYNDPHGICLGGKCQKIGCDKVIGSGLLEDECGICGGDGRKCKRFTGTYKQPAKRGNNAYTYMFVLPHGARNIRIREDAYPYNRHLIAMKKKRKGSYILNAKNQIMDGDVHLHFINANTRWEYSSRNGTETLEAAGPTNIDISVLLVSRGKNVKTSIRYSYVIHPMYIRDNVYRFEIKKRGSCSTSCGRGTRPIKYKCRNKIDGRWVRNKHCSGKPPSQKREPCVSPCKTPARWQVGEWTACTYTSCGTPGVQQRAVACRAPNGNGVVRNVAPNRCSTDKRPQPKRACTAQACACQWRTGAWSTCSQTCGTGFRRRRVLCRCGRSSAESSRCGHGSPEDVKTCENPACAGRAANSRRPIPLTMRIIRDASLVKEERCVEDKSLFCKLDEIAHYCSLQGFRRLCCRSCEDFNREHPGITSSRLSSGRAALSNLPQYANFTHLPDAGDPDFSAEFALAVKAGRPFNLRGRNSTGSLVIPELTEADLAADPDFYVSDGAVEPSLRTLEPTHHRKKRSLTPNNQVENLYLKSTQKISRQKSKIKT